MLKEKSFCSSVKNFMEKNNLNPSSYNTSFKPTWCPGCGNFIIWHAVKTALAELKIPSHKLMLSYGIGCAGNMADNIKGYAFHSLHGRSLPILVGAKLANHKLTAIAITGDGDAYGEGLNHLIHTARANNDITSIISNNHSYSLTTGQSSPTSRKGYVTKTTPWGEVKKPINPISLVLSAGASFVARGFAGDLKHLTELIKKGINHKGFAHIDVLQHCVTFNKIDTLEYYKKKVYKLEEEENYNAKDKLKALKKAEEREKLPIGIFYEESRPTYESTFPQLEKEALVEKKIGGIDPFSLSS
jgi:2-oxoglutarate ferredoxin oxidoreductase subunit beta